MDTVASSSTDTTPAVTAPQGAETRTHRPKPENKVSCSACRAVKCKCVELQGSSRCQRCTRLDIECIYKAHQRGRRRRRDSDGPSRHDTSPSAMGHERKRKRHDVSFSGLYGSPQITPAGSRTGSPEGDHSGPDRRLKPAHSVYHDVADRSVFSIAGVMERKGSVESPSVLSHSPRDDPIAFGLLSMEDCESLFWHYFDQLQTCVCLLDPAVHTARYTRRASLQLFVAVLTVAAKFFRAELYEDLLALANRLVNQAIADCVCTIELVQAICILHYWKKPIDNRGWLRLGHAIRLGYQLDLHLPRKGPLPADERRARLAIDRERTWISLYCFDATATQLSDRPSAMHSAPDVWEWMRSIPYPLPSDGQLDFAVKTSLLSGEVRQLQACRGSYEVLRSGLRRVIEDLQRSHEALLAESAVVKLTSTSVSINRFSSLAIQLLVECTSLAFAPSKHRIGLLHTCVATSLDLLDIVVEEFARKGIMPMIEDAHSVAVASTAVRLIRFMAYLDASAKASVMRKLTKIVIICRDGSRGDPQSHTAYLARFIHALLDKAHQSRPASPAASPKHLPMISPGQQKTTPDQWWDEIGQFAYQDPLQPFKEYQDFWDGFPVLAGAMNTLSMEQPVDPALNGLLEDVWDAGFLNQAGV